MNPGLENKKQRKATAKMWAFEPKESSKRKPS